MKSTEEIFNRDSKPAVEQPKAEEKPVEVKAEAPEAKPDAPKVERERDEQGKFKPKAEAVPEAPKVDTPAAPTAAKTPKVDNDDSEPLEPKAKAFYAQAKDEKRKRQALERELQSLRQQHQQPQPTIDPLKDPEGYASRVVQEAEQRSFDRILNLSEAQARRTHGDDLVSEAQDAFKEATVQDPGLYQKLNAQADPYDWVVRWHKREKFLREVNDPDEWKKQREAEIRTQVEAEAAQRQAQQRPVVPVPTPSLASASSAAPTKASVWAGPKQTNEIWKRGPTG